MPNRLKWPEANLTIEEVDVGLRVIQSDYDYLARNWTLSDDVIRAIDLALNAELTCLIRYHPLPKQATFWRR